MYKHIHLYVYIVHLKYTSLFIVHVKYKGVCVKSIECTCRCCIYLHLIFRVGQE